MSQDDELTELELAKIDEYRGGGECDECIKKMIINARKDYELIKRVGMTAFVYHEQYMIFVSNTGKHAICRDCVNYTRSVLKLNDRYYLQFGPNITILPFCLVDLPKVAFMPGIFITIPEIGNAILLKNCSNPYYLIYFDVYIYMRATDLFGLNNGDVFTLIGSNNDGINEIYAITNRGKSLIYTMLESPDCKFKTDHMEIEIRTSDYKATFINLGGKHTKPAAI